MSATCKTCKECKPVAEFETTPTGAPRGQCKRCRHAKKAQVAKDARDKHDPDGTPVPEACVKCGKGAPEVAFKWRADTKSGGWRSECNTCYNDKGYCEKYRATQLATDADAYRKRNAETHLAWAHRNPDKVREQQAKAATEAERKFKTILTASRARDIAVVEADKDALVAKLTRPCHFCDYAPEAGETLNGLDRVDNDGPFGDANTVACCAACNAMKNVQGADEFVAAIRKITAHTGVVVPSGSDGKRTRLPAFGGRAELREAPAKAKEDRLTIDAKVAIWSTPCYLCGRTPALGIDREDSSGDYTPENARPCCMVCNYMKKDMRLGDFTAHVAHIHNHTAMWTLGDVESLPLLTLTGMTKHPVAVRFEEEEVAMIFPSIATAERIIGMNPSEISNTRFRARGAFWAACEPAEYNRQEGSQSHFFAVISRLRRARLR